MVDDVWVLAPSYHHKTDFNLSVHVADGRCSEQNNVKSQEGNGRRLEWRGKVCKRRDPAALCSDRLVCRCCALYASPAQTVGICPPRNETRQWTFFWCVYKQLGQPFSLMVFELYQYNVRFSWIWTEFFRLFLSVLLLERRMCVLLPPLVEIKLNQIYLGWSATIFTWNEMRNTQSTFRIVPVLEQMHSVTFDPWCEQFLSHRRLPSHSASETVSTFSTRQPSHLSCFHPLFNSHGP